MDYCHTQTPQDYQINRQQVFSSDENYTLPPKESVEQRKNRMRQNHMNVLSTSAKQQENVFLDNLDIYKPEQRGNNSGRFPTQVYTMKKQDKIIYSTKSPNNSILNAYISKTN